MSVTRGGSEAAGSQAALGALFDGNPEIGYRGPTACAAAGITYRQLDYWARTGLVEPSVRAAHGSGSQRLYGFRDILVLKVVKRLLDTGVSLQNIRKAVDHLRHRGVRDHVELPAAVVVAILGRRGSADQAERQSGRDHIFHSSTPIGLPSARCPQRARAEVNSC